MTFDHHQQFVVLFFVGLGLILAATANLALRRASFLRRASATLLACTAAVAACWAFDGDRDSLEPVSLALIGAVVPTFLLSTSRGVSTISAVADRVRQPLAPWCGCGLLGVAVIAFAAARFEESDQVKLDETLNELDTIESLDRELLPSYFQPAKVELATDRGTRVDVLDVVNPRPPEQQLRIEGAFFRERWNRDHSIKQAPADDRTNCYGWVFTGGRHWVSNDACELILNENGYREVAKPKVGDLVVFRREGAVMHLAIVRYTARGRPPMVEGKWGFGGVFLHAVDRSSYGSNFGYVRSPRAGHLLAGLNAPAEPEPKPEEITE